VGIGEILHSQIFSFLTLTNSGLGVGIENLWHQVNESGHFHSYGDVDFS